MNERNFEYLKKQVNAVFGAGLDEELKEKLQKETADFQMYHSTKFGEDVAVTALNFRKSEQNDMFFFNSYNVNLKPAQSPDMIEQTFYVNRDSTFNIQEAYNLMCGRSVNKDLERLEKVGEGEETRFLPTGEMYNSWVNLNYKETDRNGSYKLQHSKNYDYDVEATLSKYPIKELEDPQQKAALVDALKRGDRVEVTFSKNGMDDKRSIEANPKYGTINQYDAQMKLIRESPQKAKAFGKKKEKSTGREAAEGKTRETGKGNSVNKSRKTDQSQNQGMAVN